MEQEIHCEEKKKRERKKKKKMVSHSPSPPEASSSPVGEKRTTFTAFVCLAKFDRNSTTAFPSGPLSTRHNYTKEEERDDENSYSFL